MKEIVMTRAALLLALLAACRSAESTTRPCGDCQAGSGGATYPIIVMRTYKVPLGQEKLVQRLLHHTTSYPIQVVSSAGTQTQMIQPEIHFTGNGYFVLSAPENIQDGVKQLLDELAKNPPPPPPASIDTTYWLVLGWPAKDTTVPDRLNEIAPALKGLANLGPMRFDLLERVELVALDGDEARTVGLNAEVKQTAARDGNAVQLNVEIIASGDTTGRVTTTVTVKTGQFAVLGQSGFVPKNTLQLDQKPTLFYVVRAQPAS
jgi:hypothetical protein